MFGVMVRLLFLGWTFLALAGEKAPPLVDVQATDYIAVYECKEGKLKLVWYDKDEISLKKAKEYEGKPCRVERR